MGARQLCLGASWVRGQKSQGVIKRVGRLGPEGKGAVAWRDLPDEACNFDDVIMMTSLVC